MITQLFCKSVLLVLLCQSLSAQQIGRTLEEELSVLLLESDLIVEGYITEFQSLYDPGGRIFTLFNLDIKHIVFNRTHLRRKKHITLFDWGGQIDNDNQIYEHTVSFSYNCNAVFFLKAIERDVNGIPMLCFEMTSPYVPCLRYDASDPFDNRPYYLWSSGGVWFRTCPEFISASEKSNFR